MVDRDKRIGEIAYLLWEEAGKPHGQDQHFWHIAVERYEAEIGATVPAEEPAAEPEAPASKAEPKAQAPKKHAPAKAKAVAAEPAAEPAEPKPDAKAAKDDKPKDDKPKPGKAKAKKTKDDGAPLTASWIKSEATASPKSGKRKS